MKKISTTFVIVAIAILFCFSCSKSEKPQTGCESLMNRVIPMNPDSKSTEYLFAIKVGHLYTDCGGRCVTINCKPCHFDCMGYGHVCNRAASVTLQQVGSTFTATTTDTFDLTSEDFFPMPARSLYYYTEDNNNIVYLNIPEQMVYRDTATLQFTFTGLFLTNVPEYNND